MTECLPVAMLGFTTPSSWTKAYCALILTYQLNSGLFSDQRNEELPTLLHFAAKYGLKNLTALLLTCPGALQAYSVANKHGHYPNTIAEKHGFRDLRQFIDEYVVRSRQETVTGNVLCGCRAVFLLKIQKDFISGMASCVSSGSGLSVWA